MHETIKYETIKEGSLGAGCFVQVKTEKGELIYEGVITDEEMIEGSLYYYVQVQEREAWCPVDYVHCYYCKYNKRSCTQCGRVDITFQEYSDLVEKLFQEQHPELEEMNQ